MAKDDNLRIKVLIDSRLAEGKLGKLSKLTDKLRKDTNSATNNFIRLNQVLQTSVTTMNTLVSSFNRMGTSLIRATRELRSLDRTLSSVQGRNVNVNVNANRRNTFGNFARSAMIQPIVNNVSRGGGDGIDVTDTLLAQRGISNRRDMNKIAKDRSRDMNKLARHRREIKRSNDKIQELLEAQAGGADVREALARTAGRTSNLVNLDRETKAKTKGKGQRIFKSGGFKASSLLNALYSPTAFAGALGLGSVYRMMQTTAAREQQEVKLKSLVGENFGPALHVGIEAFAAKTPLLSSDISKQVQTLSAFGVKKSNLLPYSKMVADLAVGETQAMKTLTKVLGRTKARGTLQGEERAMAIETGRIDPLYLISQLNESDFRGNVPKAFQDAQGNFVEKTVEDLVEMQRKGQITFDILLKGFEKATSAAGRYHNALEKQAVTLEGRASTAIDNITQKLADWGEIFVPVAKGFMWSFTNTLNDIPWHNENKAFFSRPAAAVLNAGFKGLTKENIEERTQIATDEFIAETTTSSGKRVQSALIKLKADEYRKKDADFINKVFGLGGGFTVNPGKINSFWGGGISDKLHDTTLKRFIRESYEDALAEKTKVPEAATIEETVEDTNAGGRRSKYIQIDIGTVQAADTMNVSSQELGDETAFLTKTALYKALGHVPEIVT